MKTLELRNRAGEIIAFALVDDADHETASKYRWHRTDGYAVTNVRAETKSGYTTARLSRLLLGLPVGDRRQVDHIDRDRLNNQRSNLRVVPSLAANMQNQGSRGGTSRFRGVSLFRPSGLWTAEARIAGKTHYLGRYTTEDEAADVASAFRAQHMPFSADALLRAAA